MQVPKLLLNKKQTMLINQMLFSGICAFEDKMYNIKKQLNKYKRFIMQRI